MARCTARSRGKGWAADLRVSEAHTRVFKVFGESSAENHETCTTESKGVRTGKGAEKLLPSL